MKLDWEIKAENHLQDTFDGFNSLQNTIGNVYLASVLYEAISGESVDTLVDDFFGGGEDNNERF